MGDSKEQELPVMNKEACLKECGDWIFIVELIEDMLANLTSHRKNMQTSVANNDHAKYAFEAHTAKGAAANLRLVAIESVSKQAEFIGKALAGQLKAEQKSELLKFLPSNDDATLLKSRPVWIEKLAKEQTRLENFLPEAKKLAAQTKPSADDDGGDDM